MAASRLRARTGLGCLLAWLSEPKRYGHRPVGGLRSIAQQICAKQVSSACLCNILTWNMPPLCDWNTFDTLIILFWKYSEQFRTLIWYSTFTCFSAWAPSPESTNGSMACILWLAMKHSDAESAAACECPCCSFVYSASAHVLKSQHFRFGLLNVPPASVPYGIPESWTSAIISIVWFHIPC